MNIFILDSFLREHLKTKASPTEIAKYLSLCSQSVECLEKKGNDWLYEIEITTNRPDCMSVYGIARELSAILPQFKIKAELLPIKEEKLAIPKAKENLPLNVEIQKSSFCPRFTAIVFDNIKVGSSPKKVQERLRSAGIRSLNNVIDISNYLMVELGQPMHTFDYDKIGKHKMILRESRKGEEITTLDKQTRKLPQGTIIMEDGEGKIIDLCGIMGGLNSAVDENTKRVLLFVQTYNPQAIRTACQLLGFRTDAAIRFEKGLEPEGVMVAIKRAITLFKDNCQGKVASRLFDIYPYPQKKEKISLNFESVEKLIGVKTEKGRIKEILNSLGFKTLRQTDKTITLEVPHFRIGDITIEEDLIEEIARIYGYHNLPNNLPPGQIPQIEEDQALKLTRRIKTLFKDWGFSENDSYSMVSKHLAEASGYKIQNHLKIANPLSEDWLYMRRSLLPSLLEVVSKNQACEKKIKLFEIANTYTPKSKKSLPEEELHLSAAMNLSNYKEAKGFIEALETLDLNLKDIEFKPLKETDPYNKILDSRKSAEIYLKNKRIGVFGEINQKTKEDFSIDSKTTIFEVSIKELAPFLKLEKKYKPISKYPAIIEDLSFIVPDGVFIEDVIRTIKATDKLIKEVLLIDSYKSTKTLRITYQSNNKNLSDKEISSLREKIIKKTETTHNATLKQQ